MHWTLRPLTEGDADALATVFARSRHAAMPWLPVLHTPEEDRGFFAGTLRSSTGWGAVVDGGLVGFAIGHDDWLDHLYVDPMWQGRGIGSALLTRMGESRDGGVQLWAFQQNLPALAFYRRHGFVEVERTDGAGNEERTPDVRMQRGLIVRPAVPADAEELAALHLAAWRAGYAGLLPADFLAGLAADERLARWRDRLADEARQVLVAVEAGRIVGFVDHGPPRDEDLARDQQRWWEVYALYVDPGHWRQGVGSRLWGAATARIPEEVAGVAVWVLAGNTRGRAAYGRWGMAPDGAERVWDPGTGPLPEVRYVGWL